MEESGYTAARCNKISFQYTQCFSGRLINIKMNIVRTTWNIPKLFLTKRYILRHLAGVHIRTSIWRMALSRSVICHMLAANNKSRRTCGRIFYYYFPINFSSITIFTSNLSLLGTLPVQMQSRMCSKTVESMSWNVMQPSSASFIPDWNRLRKQSQ